MDALPEIVRSIAGSIEWPDVPEGAEEVTVSTAFLIKTGMLIRRMNVYIEEQRARCASVGASDADAGT